MSSIEELQTECNVLGEILVRLHLEQTDLVRFLLRRTSDACRMVEESARSGTAGADQAAATAHELRDQLVRIADAWLPSERLLAYGDGSPIVASEQLAGGLIARSYLPWPRQLPPVEPEGTL